MLEQLQTQDMLLDTCVEFLQQKNFNTTQENISVFQVNKYVLGKGSV